jgi:hypothetical protein
MIEDEMGNNIGDRIGKIPKIASREQALKEILVIASDKREHVLKDDCISWLELKMKAIRLLVKRGLAAKKQVKLKNGNPKEN